jgi:hypothetical protein
LDDVALLVHERRAEGVSCVVVLSDAWHVMTGSPVSCKDYH